MVQIVRFSGGNVQAETASCAENSNCLINLVCMTMQIQVFNPWGREKALDVTT